MTSRRKLQNNADNLAMLEKLEQVLALILDLEAAYGDEDAAAAAAAANANPFAVLDAATGFPVDPFERPVPLRVSRATPDAVKALLLGGAGGAGNISTNHPLLASFEQEQQQQRQRQQRADAASSNGGSSAAKAEARAKWKQLDALLAQLAAPPSLRGCAPEEWEQIQRIVADVNAGRPDKWVRPATVQERRDQEKAFVDAVQDDFQAKAAAGGGAASSGGGGTVMVRSAVPHEIVLGSESSAVGRRILHALLS